MRPHDVYRQQQQPTMRRIDLIITLYRKAMDRLDRASQLVAEKRTDAARLLLAETQLIVSSLSSGMVGTDEASINFLRLYEFVAHKLTLGSVEDIAAARKVLTPILEGFESARDQAAIMEMQGQIPSLDRQREIQVSA